MDLQVRGISFVNYVGIGRTCGSPTSTNFIQITPKASIQPADLRRGWYVKCKKSQDQTHPLGSLDNFTQWRLHLANMVYTMLLEPQGIYVDQLLAKPFLELLILAIGKGYFDSSLSAKLETDFIENGDQATEYAEKVLGLKGQYWPIELDLSTSVLQPMKGRDFLKTYNHLQQTLSLAAKEGLLLIA